jgi:hypothetical protein
LLRSGSEGLLLCLHLLQVMQALRRALASRDVVSTHRLIVNKANQFAADRKTFIAQVTNIMIQYLAAAAFDFVAELAEYTQRNITTHTKHKQDILLIERYVLLALAATKTKLAKTVPALVKAAMQTHIDTYFQISQQRNPLHSTQGAAVWATIVVLFDLDISYQQATFYISKMSEAADFEPAVSLAVEKKLQTDIGVIYRISLSHI